jgi:hypothetical protein
MAGSDGYDPRRAMMEELGEMEVVMGRREGSGVVDQVSSKARDELKERCIGEELSEMIGERIDSLWKAREG